MFAQKLAVALDAWLQEPGRFGDLALHLRDQSIADLGIERRGIGMARGRGRHGDPAAGALMQAERVGGAGIFEIDEMKTIGNDEADGARQLLCDVREPQPDQVAQLQALHHHGAHRDRARTDPVFLVARQIDELSHPRQRVREPRDRRARQSAAIGDLEIAEPRLVALEASQNVERARYHLDDVILACKITGEHSLPTQPLRASSHALPTYSVMRNEIPLADQATSGNVPPQQEADWYARYQNRH